MTVSLLWYWRLRGDDIVNYSFIPLEALVKVYTREGTDTTETTVEDGAINVDIRLSEEDDNVLVKKDDGLYVAPEAKILAEEGDALIKKDDALYVATPEASEEIVYSTNAEVEALFS